MRLRFKLVLKAALKFFISNILFVLGLFIFNLDASDVPEDSIRVGLYLAVFFLFYAEAVLIMALRWSGLWAVVKGFITAYCCFVLQGTVRGILIESLGMDYQLVELTGRSMLLIALVLIVLPIIGLIRTRKYKMAQSKKKESVDEK